MENKIIRIIEDRLMEFNDILDRNHGTLIGIQAILLITELENLLRNIRGLE